MTRSEMEDRRFTGAELLMRGCAQAEVARLLGTSRISVARWARNLKNGGRSALKSNRAPGRPPRLTAAQVEHLKRLWNPEARWSAHRFRNVIEREIGVWFHEDHVGRLIKKYGLVKTGPALRALRARRAV